MHTYTPRDLSAEQAARHAALLRSNTVLLACLSGFALLHVLAVAALYFLCR